jgi:hypothetical protein
MKINRIYGWYTCDINFTFVAQNVLKNNVMGLGTIWRTRQGQDTITSDTQ